MLILEIVLFVYIYVSSLLFCISGYYGSDAQWVLPDIAT